VSDVAVDCFLYKRCVTPINCLYLQLLYTSPGLHTTPLLVVFWFRLGVFTQTSHTTQSDCAKYYKLALIDIHNKYCNCKSSAVVSHVIPPLRASSLQLPQVDFLIKSCAYLLAETQNAESLCILRQSFSRLGHIHLSPMSIFDEQTYVL